MAENNVTDPTSYHAGDAGEPTSDNRKPPKRRRRWPWVILSILVLLIVLVALAPTLLSTGPAKSFVVGKVNEQLNGKLDVADWSIGWTSGVTLAGVKLDDDKGRRVAEIASVRVPMSLIGAARGNLDFGDTVIDKPNLVNLEIYPDGSTNLDRLAKETTEKADEQPGDGKLPDLKGRITINGARATVTQIAAPGQTAPPPVFLESGDIKVNIPDINAAIQNDAKLVVRVGDTPPGTISVAGTVDAIENNVVDVEKLVADQKLEIANTNLSAVEPFMQSEGAKTTLAGVANGTLQLKASGLKSAGVDGQLTVTNFAYGGDALKGDVYKSNTVAIPIKVSTTAAGADTLIKIETLKVESDHVLVDVSGQAPQSALMNLADQKKPGAAGQLAVALNTKDVPGLVNSLRNTLGLQQAVQVTAGDVRTRIDLAMTPDRAVVKQTLDATAQGTNAGQPIRLEPVHLDTSVAVPDLTQIALNLTSAFATITGGGESLANLGIKGNVDLAKLRGQVGQFADLGKLDLAGSGDFNITSKGDLTKERGTADANVTLNLTNVVVRGLEGKPDLNQPRLALVTNATLVRGAENAAFLDKIAEANVTFQTGEATAPVIDVLVNATNVTLEKLGVERFEVQKMNVPDLARAQQQFAAFIPSDVQLSGGLTVATAGSYRDDTATFESLAVNHTEKLISLNKAGQGPLVVQMKNGAVGGNGELAIASDLKRVDSMLKLFGPQLQSGLFNATLNLSGQPGGATNIALNGGVTQLTITTNEQPIQNETIKLAVKASTPADFSAVAVEQVLVESAFAKTTVTETLLKLQGGVFDMVQKAKIQVAIPDLARTYAVVNAFAPPATQPTTQPLNIAGGAVVNVDVSRDEASKVTRVSIPEIAASNVSLTRGPRQFAFDKPIKLNLVADVGTKKVPTTASTQPVDQVDQVRVTQLAGDLGGLATLSAPDGVTLTNLTGEQPNANGKVAINGPIEPLMRLLSVVQGADAMPYRGDYTITQNVGTASGQIKLAGDATVNKFIVLGADQKPAFTEEKIVLANDLVADTRAKTATINNVALTMSSSQAASVTIKGQVQDWEQQRKFNNTTLDLAYDLQKLWPMIKPMLAPETQEQLKDLKVAGQFKRTFNVKGSYPATAPTGTKPIKHLSADGALAVQLLNTSGIDLQNLEIPITLTNGQITTLYANRPRNERAAKPAAFNGGTLDLNSMLIDLNGDEPRLSIGKNQKLVAGASINELLGETMGKYINPVFTNSKRAKGLLDVTIVQCDNLALGEGLKSAKSGNARVLFSLSDMDIANPVGALMLAPLINGFQKVIPSLSGTGPESEVFQGQIKDATIVVANGRTTQDVTMLLVDPGVGAEVVGQAQKPQATYMPLTFKGNIDLASLQQQLNVRVPPQLLAKFIPDREWKRKIIGAFPDGIPAVMGGTTAAPKVEYGNIVSQTVQSLARQELTERIPGLIGGGGKDAAKDGKSNPAGGIIGDILGGGNRPKDGGTSTTQPARNTNPLGGLLEGLGGQKKESPPQNPPQKKR